MSKILKHIYLKYGENNMFFPSEISFDLKINQKIVSMVLKRYHNTELLHYNSTVNGYSLNPLNVVLKKRKEANEIIDKYQLKNKK
jgi:Mn-dependent DtxR family transcriptional regulator